MLEESDVRETAREAVEYHVRERHRPSIYMPIQPFMARLDEDHADDPAAMECRVVGVRQWDDRTDFDDHPMLQFVVIASDGQGTLLPRVVPYVEGNLPGV